MTQGRQRGAAKRRLFFDQGVAALDAIGAGAGGGYACPLCLRVFPAKALEAKVLTLEHVPPRRLGGKEITLTCVECNSTAGAGPDAAMRRRQVVEDFWRGHGGELVMKLTMGGRQVSATVSRGPDGSMSVTGRPKHTNPTAQAGWQQYLERKAAQGGPLDKFSLTTRWYDVRLAAVGDLRTAYLAAFAKLGYTYILRRALDRVRAQLQKPKKQILTLVQFTRADAAPETRTMAVCDTPVPCLGVQVGQRLSVLPSWRPSGVDPYKAIEAAPFAEGQPVSWEGDAFDWPTGMELILDVRSKAS